MINSEVLLYSAPCANGPTYSITDCPPIDIIVSKATNTFRAIKEGEAKEIIDNAKEYLDGTKEVLNTGKSVYELAKTLKNKEFKINENIGKGLEVIGGLATILKGVSRLIPGDPDPTVTALQDLADNVEDLGKRIGENFEEMKSQITEINFFSRIVCPTTILVRYMANCIKNPGKDSYRNFKRAYEKYPPIFLLYSLRTYLERKSTNPLRMAMAAETAKTKKTFNKWEDIIGRILGQFVVLEIFGSVYLGKKDQFNWDRLLQIIESISKMIIEWRKEFEKPGDEYWKEIHNFVDPYLENHKNLSLSQKADDIKAKLDTYFTDDAFYVLVFTESPRYIDSQAHCPDHPERLVESWYKTGCTVLIYRSRQAHKKSKEEFKRLENEVESLKNRLSGDVRHIIANQIIRELSTDGFIAVIRENKDVHIRSSNCPGHEWGPGWWVRADIQNNGRFYLLASFY